MARTRRSIPFEVSRRQGISHEFASGRRQITLPDNSWDLHLEDAKGAYRDSMRLVREAEWSPLSSTFDMTVPSVLEDQFSGTGLAPTDIANFFALGGSRSVLRVAVRINNRLGDTAWGFLVTTIREAMIAERLQPPNSTEKALAGSFVHRATLLHRKGNASAALDHIYDAVDEMLIRGDLEQIDSSLKSAVVDSLPVEIMLALLTATLPARTKLSSRREFFKRVEDALETQGLGDPRLLAGLE